jgi:hypothetical protein
MVLCKERGLVLIQLPISYSLAAYLTRATYLFQNGSS